MLQCEIKVENRQERQKSKKPFPHLPITTPWKYKVPSNIIKSKTRNYLQNTSLKNESTRQPVPNLPKYNTSGSFEKQYYNFLRLMHLFPSIHPANIHGILLTCNYDICRAAEKLKRAIRVVKGPYRPNVNKFENLPQLNYVRSQTIPRYNNKYYNCYPRSTQPLRNYFNVQLPVTINTPNSGSMVPNCYNGPKIFYKYANMNNMPQNVYC